MLAPPGLFGPAFPAGPCCTAGASLLVGGGAGWPGNSGGIDGRQTMMHGGSGGLGRRVVEDDDDEDDPDSGCLGLLDELELLDGLRFISGMGSVGITPVA